MSDDKKQKVLDLFYQIQDREDEIAELRNEIKTSIEQFCDDYEEYTVKAVKEAFRVFKKMNKDRVDTIDFEQQRDQIVNMLLNI